jgi:hypothetical protein
LKQLHEELKGLGFEGSYDRVAAFARVWRAGQTDRVNSASKRTIWILCSVAAGAGVVYVFPASWFMPIFLGSIAATLLCGIAARLSVKDDHPVNPVVDIAAVVLSVTSRPLAKVPSGWPLQGFLILSAFVISLALAVVLRANA